MNKLALALVAINFTSFALQAAQPEINPSRIDVYVTPYYDSKGPAVSAAGLVRVWRQRRKMTFLLPSLR